MPIWDLSSQIVTPSRSHGGGPNQGPGLSLVLVKLSIETFENMARYPSISNSDFLELPSHHRIQLVRGR